MAVGTGTEQRASFGREYTPGYQRTGRSLFVLPDTKDKSRTDRPESPLVEMCEGLFLSAKNYRDNRLGMRDRWSTYRSWYLNSNGLDDSRAGTPVNIIYEKIENLTAHLAQGKPDFLFQPNTVQDIGMTHLLNDGIPWVWSSQSMASFSSRTWKAALLYGTVYWKVIHDPQFGKTGSIEKTLFVPPWNGFPCPYSTSFEDCPWFIETTIRTVGEIENDYGIKVNPEVGVSRIFPPIEDDLRQYSEVSGWVETAGTDGIQAGGLPPQPVSGGQLVEGVYGTAFGSDLERAGVVIQKELWIRDGQLASEFWVDDADGVEMPVLKKSMTLKYPGGRVISWANGKLLYDRPNPYKDGRFPYVRFVDVPIPDFWYGMGEVEQLIPLQLLHDDTHEIIKNIHLYTALGRMVVDTGTGLTEDDIGNEAGEILFVNPGTADRIKWMPGSAPPPELYTYIQLLERSSDLITGSPDVTRGIRPVGVTSARGLQTLQAAASVRIRERLTDIEDGLEKWARLMASRIQQFWGPELTLRIGGPEGLATASRHFAFKDFFISPADREAAYNVKVSVTSSLDEVKNQNFLKLVQMAQLGFPIPPDTLIRTASLIDEEEILAAMAMKQAQAAAEPQTEVLSQ